MAEDDSPRTVLLNISHALKKKALRMSGEREELDSEGIKESWDHPKEVEVQTQSIINFDRDDSVLITVCEMKKTKSGVFTGSKNPFLELKAYRGDSYAAFVARAAHTCGITKKDKAISLFKLNGARVLDETITIKGKAKPWTLGNYLLLMKKSPNSVKMGVGYVDILDVPDSSLSSDKEEDSDDAQTGIKEQFMETCGEDQPICIKYVKHVEGKSRQVDTLTLDGIELLAPLVSFRGDLLGLAVQRNSGVSCVHKDIGIEWESPARVTVRSWKKAVTLYCSPTMHPKCLYNWTLFGDVSAKFLSTPFIYVDKGGLYQCVVKFSSKELQGRIITVSVDVDSDCEGSTTLSHSFKERRVVDLTDSDDSDGVHAAVTSTKKHPRRGISFKKGCGSRSGSARKLSVELTAKKNAPIPSPCVRTSKLPSWSSVAKASVGELPQDPLGGTRSNQQPSTEVIAISDSSASGSSVSQSKSKVPPAETIALGSGSMQFTEEVLLQATQNFSPSLELGAGGFGTVYKGRINGSLVAVKKLTEIFAVAAARSEGQNVPIAFTLTGQLETEMKALTRCRHRNLVPLMGYCLKPPMLIYEYMEEGSLYDKLFLSNQSALTWAQRSKIVKEVYRGLLWLHSASPPLIHEDVKASNVLLDHYYTAKFGDFGFTQELPLAMQGRTMITSAAVAKSLGYSPPELDTCCISPKSDIYSYGVVTLETFTGQMAFMKDREDQLLTEHLDESRKSVEGYKAIADGKAGELPHYLVLLYIKIIEGSLVKHSKRPSSEVVMNWWNETNY